LPLIYKALQHSHSAMNEQSLLFTFIFVTPFFLS